MAGVVGVFSEADEFVDGVGFGGCPVEWRDSAKKPPVGMCWKSTSCGADRSGAGRVMAGAVLL
ncbi:hypothetical protein LRS71_22570 [Rhodococcus pyridinivorans]|uniref:hypothetical protein n=1 Tax=Rhodococcus pyridinivorans TaxID=103816 RepID=UPI001E4D9F8F|nr:hypothetical protein [Rhodococcus pyridinivorans]MCD5422306.1 hypothetical protein [Rhodococcus pyridinivorans]